MKGNCGLLSNSPNSGKFGLSYDTVLNCKETSGLSFPFSHHQQLVVDLLVEKTHYEQTVDPSNPVKKRVGTINSSKLNRGLGIT